MICAMQTNLELQGRRMGSSKRGYESLGALTLSVTLLPVACVTCRYANVDLLVYLLALDLILGHVMLGLW